MKKYLIFFFCFFFSLHARPPKLLFLGIVNKEKKANIQYLESSLSDAILKKLQDRFVFTLCPESEWKPLAKENNFFKEEWDQKSVALNLGLMLRQDVVISGSYRVQGMDTPNPQVVVFVRVIHTRTKKVVSEKTMRAFINNKIWDAVNYISNQIAKEAAKALPNKNEYNPSLAEMFSDPIFEKPSVFLGTGYQYFHANYGNRIRQIFPTLTAGIKAYMPILHDSLLSGFSISYHREKVNLYENISGIQVRSSVYQARFLFLWEFALWPRWFVLPQVSTGIVLRDISVSGFVSDSFSTTPELSFAGGIEVQYQFKRVFRVGLLLRSNSFLESQKVFFGQEALLQAQYDI
ncbi:MAG: hypothetical protein D6767_06480 [Candidatus Hydrogenedentota bacterium]|nr:MAG: hypothetical protein D6767_06480 [Candidatus Hydrogenedentota bacterium]